MQKSLLNNFVKIAIKFLFLSFLLLFSCTDLVNRLNTKGIEIQSEKIFIYAGQEKNITVYLIDSNSNKTILEENLSTASSNPEVASVDNKGLIKGLSTGTSKITIKYLNFIKNVDVTVQGKKQIREIKITPSELVLKKGFVKSIMANVIFNDYSVSSDISWSSSDKNIVVVDEFGKVSAKESGKAKIFASYLLDETFKTFIDVTVE